MTDEKRPAGDEATEQRDVVVIGGGPAGSTAATLLAREGHDVLLVDRDDFPRFRIGESLMPASYWTLKRLGMLEKLAASRFPRKHSVRFYTADGRASSPFYFSEVDSHESAATWQVDRVEFDKMLLDNARDSGATVRLRTKVRDVEFDGGAVSSVLIESEQGEQRRVDCRVVVDATGQTSLLARKLGLRVVDPLLQHVSYFTRYRGARRDSGIDEGGTLIMRTREDRSWFWFIPLPDDLVSVGVVGPTEYLTKGRPSDPEQVFGEELERCPAMQERLESARREHDVRVIRDFSYISTQIAGDGWVLAGDAFGFLDPIYSTGVFLALTSAELAADSVNEAFRAHDFSAARLGRHGQRYVDGMEAMRKLVYAYYSPSFSVPRFLKKHPQYRDQVVNLLVGNVFRKPTEGLFEAMEREIELPASRKLTTPEPPR